MNNKKLFKGALVLFASILMAVSCSNNNTSPEGDGTQKPGDTTTTTKVTFTKADIQNYLQNLPVNAALVTTKGKLNVKFTGDSDNKLGNLDFTSVTINTSGDNFVTEREINFDPDSSSAPTAAVGLTEASLSSQIKSALEGASNKPASIKTIEVTSKKEAGNKNATVVITFTDKNGAKATLTFKTKATGTVNTHLTIS